MRVVALSLCCALLVLCLPAAMVQADATPAPTPATVVSTREQADALRRDAATLRQKKDYVAAVDKLSQALEIYTRLGDDRGRAQTLGDIAAVASEAGLPAQALPFYQDALEAWRQTDDRAGQASTLQAMGDIYAGQSQPAQASDAYQQALVLRRQISDRPGQIETLRSLAATQLFSLNQTAQALESYQAALALQREAGDRAGQAQTLRDIALVYGSHVQFSLSIDYYRQALTIYQEIGDNAGLADTWSNIALINTNLGQYPQALAAYQQSLVFARKSGGGWREARTLQDVARSYVNLGQYTKALEAYEQAIASARINNDTTTEVFSLSSVGRVYVLLGQTQKALDAYQRALARARALGAGVAEEGILHSIGNLYHSAGDYDQALSFYQQAWEAGRAASYSYDEPYLLYDIGLLQLSWGKAQAALQAHVAALATFQARSAAAGEGTTMAGNVRQMECYTANEIGRDYLTLGENDRALEYFTQSLTLCQAAGDRYGQANVLYNIGLTNERKGLLAQALADYEQSLATFEDVRSSVPTDERRINLASWWVGAYQHAILLLERNGQAQQAFDLTEQARARIFLDQIGNTHLNVQRAADAALAEEERSLRVQIAALQTNLRQATSGTGSQRDAGAQILSAELAAKQRAYSELISLIKQTSPEFASLVSVSPLALADLQKLLDKDTTLVSYFFSGDAATLAFVVTQTDFHAVELQASFHDIYTAILELRDFADLSQAPPPSLTRLYSWLITPIEHYLKTPVVGIVPHDILHYVPFAAMSDGKSYLGDKHTLFYLPNATSLLFVQHKQTSGGRRLLAIAQDQAPDLPTLHFANREVQEIARLYSTQPLLGEAATVSAFAAAAVQANLIHLAAHGQLNTLSPLFSRIVLAPEGDSDGSLTVSDVYGLDLQAADLVVLSACQTQLGAHATGDDIIGLTRAFMYAGAPSVISSLWSVDDQATSLLMTSFYKHLKQGMSKAAALRAAQADTRAKYPNPYYWAAFVLTGDPGEATSSAPTPTQWAAIALGVMALALAMLLAIRSFRRRRSA